MGFRRGFKAEANRISLRVREKLGLEPMAPVDPAEICTHFEIDLWKLSEMPCDVTAFLGVSRSVFSAATVPYRHRVAIVHNDSHDPNRQCSNICHELAHCMLGHKAAPPLTEDGARNYDSGIEGEANFLGGALLIPNEAAIYIVRNELTATARLIYGVSNQMLQYRLHVSGAHVVHERYLKRKSA